MTLPASYLCSRCGERHDGVPLAQGFLEPAYVAGVPVEERAARVQLTPDACIIDEEHFFIRGRIEVPLVDADDVFAWVVWCSLSRANFERAESLWNDPGRASEAPYFGWLSNRIPGYPDTLNLKTHVHTRAPGLAPTVELEPSDHPLSLEQRQGISMARVIEIAQLARHA